MRKKLDLSVSADTRNEVACQQDIAYGKIFFIDQYMLSEKEMDGAWLVNMIKTSTMFLQTLTCFVAWRNASFVNISAKNNFCLFDW